MIALYITKNKLDSKRFLHDILSRFFGLENYTLSVSQNGKPYIDGNPLYFSISHSADVLAIAVADQEIGLDIEKLRSTENYASVYKRLTTKERGEATNPLSFFKNWTAKESFVKMNGDTLAKFYPRLSFEKGELFLDEKKQEICLSFYTTEEFICSICTKQEDKLIIINL